MLKALTHAFLLGSILGGAGGTAAAQDSAGGNLSGSVRDTSGALMQAVTVEVFPPDADEDTAPLHRTTTDGTGAFALDLPAGEYWVEVSAPGFQTLGDVVRVEPGLTPLEITLPLDIVVQEIAVSGQAEDLVGDPSVSLTATTLSGDELLDLPDTEEELARYLLMLAGADTTGDLEDDVLANFIIDGFDDGRLPRPDQISQIIIDPNSMRANGSGPRIEIVTRPGSGRWRRSLNFGFADESLNARTPGEINRPARQTRDLQLEVSGPVIPNLLAVELEASTRNEESAGNSLRAITPNGGVFQGVVRPEIEREFGISGELDLGRSRRLDVSFEYASGRSRNGGVGGFNLPERGADERSSEWSLDIRQRLIGNDLTNDIQFQVSRENERQVPVSGGFAIDVADAFNGGGGTDRSLDEETTFQVENTLRWEREVWNFEFGVEAQHRKRVSLSEDNYNGAFEFASLHDYCLATNFAGVNCQETRQIVEAAAAAGTPPAYRDARGREVEITGAPTTFTQTFGNTPFTFREFGFNTFLQADRRLGERASLRLGLRYDATNHSVDFLRINPTVNVQYRIFDGTQVSLGAQLNFRDFGDRERLLRNDGATYAQELSISSPSFPDPYQSGQIELDEELRSMDRLDPDYQSPYNISPQISLTQQLPGNLRLTLSHRLDYGIHQQRVRNINAPYPGTPLPEEILALPRDLRQEAIDRMRPFYPIVGNIRQIESTGRSAGRDFRARLQPRGDFDLLGLRFSGSIDYGYSAREDDNDFNNPYVREWGPAERQHEVQSQFRFRLPDESGWSSPFLRSLAAATYQGVNLNFNFRARTGQLYSITSGTDLNGDQSSRDRPTGISRNTETGPGSWNLDMTFTKEFRVGGDEPPTRRAANGFSGPQRGGGFGGAQASPPTRIRLQARVNNLLNHSQPRAYSGVLTSPFFGQPTGFTGGRTIQLSMGFEF